MNDKNTIKISTVAHIRTDFTEKFGIPRQSGRAPSATGKIVFTKDFKDPSYIKGIQDYTHLWLIFGFSGVEREPNSPTVRPPRLGGNVRVGVFATRSPFRPNKLGLSSVKLEGVESTPDGNVIIVSGVDLLDNTPIYDIKPYIPSADCHSDAVGGFSEQFTNYKIKVEFSDGVIEVLPQPKRQTLIEIIADDPRPSYQDDGREYGVAFAGYNFKFTVSGGVANVFKAEKIN